MHNNMNPNSRLFILYTRFSFESLWLLEIILDHPAFVLSMFPAGSSSKFSIALESTAFSPEMISPLQGAWEVQLLDLRVFLVVSSIWRLEQKFSLEFKCFLLLYLSFFLFSIVYNLFLFR